MRLWNMKVWLIVAVQLVSYSLANTQKLPEYRLPNNVIPTYYDLFIKSHLNEDGKGFRFEGHVLIKVLCKEATNEVVLHTKNLELDEKLISVQELKDNQLSDNISINHTSKLEQHDLFNIHLNHQLNPNSIYNIKISFTGKIEPVLLGYYRSNYFDKSTNETKWLTVTQFEPIHARNAFPCFDEPEMKASFEIHLIHQKQYTALSNMNIKSVKPLQDDPTWIQSNFEPTVPMSTYLVAYSLNEFKNKESETNMQDQILFKTWARPDAINQVDYASDIGPKVLKFYEDYFNIKYPLPKMDQIAIPDFSAGAMENWGLVTYRETALLYDPLSSSLQNKNRVASVIAHELAHQWFGNLVTMSWWTDLWLNEGFATYIATLGVEHLHPEWKSYKEESLTDTLHVFDIDSYRTSHPVSVPIGNPNEISQIFDGISYSKGSCLIRMMHTFLGEKAFREGVSNYLKEHEYHNAEQVNLWDSLSNAAQKLKSLPENLNLRKVMDSWTKQTGYPVINVTRYYDNHTAVLTQERFLADRMKRHDDSQSCWWIPLSYTTGSKSDFNSLEPKDWMLCDAENKRINHTLKIDAEPDQWVLFNIQLGSLYKVNYDKQNWNLLIKTLNSNHEQINEVNRAQLVGDALDLAKTGYLDYDLALNVVKYLKDELHCYGWRAALGQLSDINVLLRRTANYGGFLDFMRPLLAHIYSVMNPLSDEKDTDQSIDRVNHKQMIVKWACSLGISDCVHRAIHMFEEFMNSTDPNTENHIPVNVRSAIYCTAIREGDDREWNFLWERYLNSNVGAEKAMILSTLGCTKQPSLLIRYLEWAHDPKSAIRKQDSSTVFTSIASSSTGYLIARDYLFQNIKQIYEHLKPDNSRLSRYVKPLASQIISEHELNEFKAFIKQNSKYFEKSSKAVHQSIEAGEINIEWHKKNYNNIGHILAKMSQ